MITRLRVRNYKCFENLTVSFGRLNLLMGGNGSGKSTVLEVLDLLRRLVTDGEKASVLFPRTTISRWTSELRQTFELEAKESGNTHLYEVTITHSGTTNQCLVTEESYHLNGVPQATFEGLQLHAQLSTGGAQSSVANGERSPLGVVAASAKGSIVHGLMRILSGVSVHRLVPERMQATLDESAPRLSLDGANFSSWYRAILQRFPDRDHSFRHDLQEAISGLEKLTFAEISNTGSFVLLAAVTGTNGSPHDHLTIEQLSDGQRALMVLYAIRRFLVQAGAVVCVDEPDNYISLSEIQPWLDGMNDASDETGAQLIFSSHHPEMLNRWAEDYGIHFTRDELGRVTCRRYEQSQDMDLSPAELLARGWELG